MSNFHYCDAKMLVLVVRKIVCALALQPKLTKMAKVSGAYSMMLINLGASKGL